MRMRFDIFLALVLAVALAAPSIAQQPADPNSGCSDSCTPEACPPAPTYEDNPVDLTDWQDCDVCCVDNTAADGYLTDGKQALIDKGVCAPGDIVLVGKVSDCTAAVNAAFGGAKLNVCILGHGAPGLVSMGAGKGANNGMAGGDRDCLDDVSKPFFIEQNAGKIEEVHIFACSTGQDWDFLQWLAQGLDAHVGAPDKAICSGANGKNKCFWFEEGGAIHTAWPVPHFSTVNIFEANVLGDSGPVDTVALGIGAGPFVYQAIPAGVELDGMINDELPDGLSIDSNTGAISGTATSPGVFHVGCFLNDPKTGMPWDILWWKIIIDDGSIPHFKDIHFVTTGEPVDTGPVDTEGFAKPGPYGFEVVPPGQVLGGITSDEVPTGLVIDPDTGAVFGKAQSPGQYHVLCVVTRKGTWEVVAYLWWDFIIDGIDIPAVSEWGLMVMTLLALTAGTVVIGRRRRPTAA